MSDDLESCDLHHETVRALMAGVRTAANRMKSSLPPNVDVNDVVTAGYLALTQALAYWQEGSEDEFELHAMKRASAAMVATARTTKPPSRNGERFVNEMDRVQRSLFDELGATEDPPAIDEGTVGTSDTLVSPPYNSERPESHVDAFGDQDIAMEEIGVHVA